MDNKRKALIVSAILIGLGGFYIYKNMKIKYKVVEQADETPKSGVDTTKILSKGSTGLEVEILQKALKGGLIVDGNFGSMTEKRLKAITGQNSISITDYNKIILSKLKK
jgi:peptidoglycan hydrolase-like protein with peptidoglycan-binding domain